MVHLITHVITERPPVLLKHQWVRHVLKLCRPMYEHVLAVPQNTLANFVSSV